MSHQTAEHNPFMLMLNPEMVLAAIEKSERLSQLNRHLCRPLDRPAPVPPGQARAADGEDDAEGEDAGLIS